MGQLLVTVKRWRTWILTILVVAILMATLPGAIRRILQTGDLYLFTRQFFDDMLARLLGSGRFRFVLQPIVVVLLGLCDGLKDARKGGPSFLWALPFFGPLHFMLNTAASCCAVRLYLYAKSLQSQSLLDILSQFLIFHEIHAGAALILGPVLIGGPRGGPCDRRPHHEEENF